MTICLTRGLGCPIGAVVIGSISEIVKIKNIRKALGGGLWHPGLLTAAAAYSLQHILPEIPKDNEMAKLLA
jgi:threonine aldolase